MPVNVLMPALSPTMTEGTLAKWHVKVGDEVSAGDIIAEIETDKATMEVEAVDEGTVGKLLVDEGASGVPVNEPIALLLAEGEDSSALDKGAPEGGAPEKGGKAEEAKSQPEKKGNGEAPPPEKEPSKAKETRPSEPPPEAPRNAAMPDDAPPAPPAPHDAEGRRIFASPLARRMAKLAGIDLSALKGSGPHGRIVKADIEDAREKGVAAPEKAPAAAAPEAAPRPAGAAPGAKELADAYGMRYRVEPLSNMRKTIARRLSEAKRTVPHFYLTIDCELDKLLGVRKELNGRSEDLKLSVNDFIVRASALALKKVPAANVSFDEQGMLVFEHADISVAVATPNGLITPIVHRAETKGLAQISEEMKDLAGRARQGKLKPDEYQGGSFSLSNLGMYGVRDFAAIINPPQGCILAVGAGEKRPVIRDDAVQAATMMSCTLSVDHRVVDGAIGAEFLAAFKKLIEDPLTMLL